MQDVRRNHHIAEMLRAERSAQDISFNRLGQMVYDRLGAFAPTVETIRVYHDPERIPDQVNPVVLSALFDIYEAKVIDLDGPMGEDLKRVADLMKRQTGWLSPTVKVPALAGR